VAEIRAGVMRSTESVRRGWQKKSKKDRMMLVAIAGGLVLVAAVAVVVVAILSRPVPTGTLALDAIPWATVTRIEAEDGTVQPLPEQASTPLTLTLPLGTYRITLAGPPPQQDSRVVTIEVGAEGVASPAPERFTTITLEEYFEQYLASPASGPADGTASAPATSDPAAPLAPTSDAAASPPAAVTPGVPQ
jgi:hypothetical protein